MKSFSTEGAASTGSRGGNIGDLEPFRVVPLELHQEYREPERFSVLLHDRPWSDVKISVERYLYFRAHSQDYQARLQLSWCAPIIYIPNKRDPNGLVKGYDSYRVSPLFIAALFASRETLGKLVALMGKEEVEEVLNDLLSYSWGDAEYQRANSERASLYRIPHPVKIGAVNYVYYLWERKRPSYWLDARIVVNGGYIHLPELAAAAKRLVFYAPDLIPQFSLRLGIESCHDYLTSLFDQTKNAEQCLALYDHFANVLNMEPYRFCCGAFRFLCGYDWVYPKTTDTLIKIAQRRAAELAGSDKEASAEAILRHPLFSNPNHRKCGLDSQYYQAIASYCLRVMRVGISVSPVAEEQNDLRWRKSLYSP